MAPKYVRWPVASTTALPVPLTTLLPMNSRFGFVQKRRHRCGVCVGLRVELRSCVKLLYRHRFAAERGLRNEQIARFDQPQIARHHVARRQQHDVAGNQLFQEDLRGIMVKGTWLARG